MELGQNKLQFWPEFWLGINSVEPIKRQDNPVRIKPLFHASPTPLIRYAFLKPARIVAEWMYVELLDDGLKPLGKGWILWQKDGRLLITYSLFS